MFTALGAFRFGRKSGRVRTGVSHWSRIDLSSKVMIQAEVLGSIPEVYQHYWHHPGAPNLGKRLQNSEKQWKQVISSKSWTSELWISIWCRWIPLGCNLFWSTRMDLDACMFFLAVNATLGAPGSSVWDDFSKIPCDSTLICKEIPYQNHRVSIFCVSTLKNFQICFIISLRRNNFSFIPHSGFDFSNRLHVYY